MIFEVHITGDEAIHAAAPAFGMKTIGVELLTPSLDVLRIEHMTSQVLQFPTFEDCFDHVSEVVIGLEWTVKIVRVKIECPVYELYIPRSLYIESHFDLDLPLWPTSRNIKKTQLMGTDRVYDQAMYPAFREKWAEQTQELCLYDSFIDEDKDWLGLWSQPGESNDLSILAE